LAEERPEFLPMPPKNDRTASTETSSNSMRRPLIRPASACVRRDARRYSRHRASTASSDRSHSMTGMTQPR
jgi:hypothetical protein